MIIGNGNKQNNQDKVNVNTKAKQFMNKDGFCPSTLIFGYWNEAISLKIHPALPKDKQTRTSVYDYTQVINTSLSIEKALTLVEKIEEIIEPAIKDNICKSIAVRIGDAGLVQIGSGIKGEIRPFIGIHKNLDPNTRIPSESYFYEFANSSNETLTIIEDYNHEDGSYKGSSLLQTEFILFKEFLKESVRGLTMVSSHADRYVNKFYRDKVLNDMAEIGGKMGLQLKRENNNFGGYTNNRNTGNMFGNSNNNYSNSGNQASVNNLNNLSDIDSFLD
ncbi:hypothetical protein [Romboutsia ilealis]|uniref:hypothetical protein n=1 Tax=Romboutsia ilealis TaxID=1115758 RepID=UPI00272AD4C3|nr:hypothetical protein [Romboutsia ilealis]